MKSKTQVSQTNQKRPGKNLTDKEVIRIAQFNVATEGMSTWSIAKLLNTLIPGHDFRGCGKPKLREEFINGYLSKTTFAELRKARVDYETHKTPSF